MSDSQITAGEIAALRTACDGATRGPWQVEWFTKPDGTPRICDGKPMAMGIHTVDHHPQLQGPEPVVSHASGIDPYRNDAPYQRVHIDGPDAEFIVAARAALPKFLDHYDAMKERLERQSLLLELYRLKRRWDGGGMPERLAPPRSRSYSGSNNYEADFLISQVDPQAEARPPDEHAQMQADRARCLEIAKIFEVEVRQE